MFAARVALLCIATLRAVHAQFPPQPEDVRIVKSKLHPGISISYKEPGICETTPGVKSYAGYVHLPPGALNETHEDNSYPINTFFWFFEARKDPHNAPLAIWLNGGPGGSSLLGGLSENGPCFVGNDSNSTYLNPWSWNNEVNMLFIDQPNQVGYSYDTPTNVTLSRLRKQFDMRIQPTDFSNGVPEQNATCMVGTVSSQNVSYTASTTRHAAVALWHFAQTWFEEFPVYKPADEQISLFTESYGGHYGPAFVYYFMRQNELITNGTISGPGVHYLHLNTLGIVNGCINLELLGPAYAEFAWNNTYGIKAFNESQYQKAIHELKKPGGALDQIEDCNTLERMRDPNDYGDRINLNIVCALATSATHNATTAVYHANGKNGWFDITHPAEDSFPPAYLIGFLNQQWVQRALGVPVNHSAVSPAVSEAFKYTGDMAKGGLSEDLAYILDHGVKVAMLYGDRDFACNWIGGEASSLKIPWKHKADFAAAGYTPLVLDPFHSGGLTRQYGNLSFTRVYQAGHMVPSYQPEAAYEIFMRALTGKDIATGTLDLQEIAARGEQYSTTGPSDTWWMRNEVLPSPPGECYIWDMSRCTEEEKDWIFDGRAVIKDWIVVGHEENQRSIGSGIVQKPLLGDW